MYRINVAKKGQDGRFRHYFRVETEDYGPRAAALYRDLADRFPECEITVTEWTKTGRDVTVAEMMKGE